MKKNIEWIFEKIFRQVTMDGTELYQSSFESISKKTFENDHIHCLISQLTMNHVDIIKTIILSDTFRQFILFSITKNKLHVSIILSLNHETMELIERGYKICDDCSKLIVVNNNVSLFCSYQWKMHRELLSLVPNESFYFLLRNKNDLLIPNESIYIKLVSSESVKIVEDVSKEVSLSDKVIAKAFESNSNDVITFIIGQAELEHTKISPNMITYPILNSNYKIIEFMEIKGLFQWHDELFFSALLSGSMEMIHFVEQKLSLDHSSKSLDTSKSGRKGQRSLLLDDMIYRIDGKSFFSHTMNYAIQSNSIEVVKYIHGLGYGITPSNIITAIKQADIDIIEYLCSVATCQLGPFVLSYFGTRTNISDKLNKMHVLLKNELVNLNHKNVSDYQRDSTHQSLNNEIVLSSKGSNDDDFLLKRWMFFGSDNKNVVLVRYHLFHDHHNDLIDIFSKQKNKIPLSNALFLFGSFSQIKTYFDHVNVAPDIIVIMEIACYGDLKKICFLIQKNMISLEARLSLRQLAVALDDDSLKRIVGCLNDERTILLSKNIDVIGSIENKTITDLSDAKVLLSMDNYDLTKKFDFSGLNKDVLMEWCCDNNYIDSMRALMIHE